MNVSVLDEHEVRRLLPMEECIEVMAEALASLARGEVHNPLRFVVRPPDAPSLMGLMPAYRAAPAPLYSLKSVVHRARTTPRAGSTCTRASSRSSTARPARRARS